MYGMVVNIGLQSEGGCNLLRPTHLPRRTSSGFVCHSASIDGCEKESRGWRTHPLLVDELEFGEQFGKERNCVGVVRSVWGPSPAVPGPGGFWPRPVLEHSFAPECRLLVEA